MTTNLSAIIAVIFHLAVQLSTQILFIMLFYLWIPRQCLIQQIHSLFRKPYLAVIGSNDSSKNSIITFILSTSNDIFTAHPQLVHLYRQRCHSNVSKESCLFVSGWKPCLKRNNHSKLSPCFRMKTYLMWEHCFTTLRINVSLFHLMQPVES